MRRSLSPWVLPLLLATATTLASCGGARPPEVDYPPLADVDRAPAEGTSSVEILLRRLEIRFDEDGKFTRTFHQRYRVLDQAGVEGWGSIEVEWSPWHMERPEVVATVTSSQGVESKLEPAALSEAAAYPNAPDVYGDERVRRGPLPNVAVGAVVDETITTRYTRPWVGDGQVFEVPFQLGVPVERSELVVDYPESMPLAFEIRGAKVTRKDDTKGARRVVSFSSGPVGALQTVEEATPSEVDDWPNVAFSNVKAWKPAAAEYARIVDGKLDGANLEGVVAKVVAKDDAPEVKATKLLAWLRDRVRYVAIEFGDSGVVPRTPDETLRHGYGDCKDQAVLMVGLLRAAGVPAEVALLRAGYGEDVHPDLAGLNVFNHAIVHVPGKRPFWIDPTASRARAGELPGPDQGRLALLVDRGSESLVRTPHADHADNTYKEVRQIFFSEYGNSRVVETTTGTGALERNLRDAFDANAESLAKWQKGYVSKTYDSEKPGKIEVSSTKDLSAPFSIVVEANDAQFAVTDVFEATLWVDPLIVFANVPKSLVAGDERHADYALSTPHESTIVYEVHGPAGFVAVDKPAPSEVQLGPASFRQSVDVRADGVVVVTEHLTLPKDRWTPADVTAFRKAYAALRAQKSPALTFVHEGERQFRARAYDKSLAAYRAEVAKSPDAMLPKLRMALALRALGFGASARRWADDVAKTNPTDADVWADVAYVRQCDLLGRNYHAGWDRAGAIAALRKAVERDPKNLYAATALGMILEYDDAAVRYAPGAKLDEALAVYDAIPVEKLKAYKDHSYFNNVLFDLFWLGRHQDVRDRVKGMETGTFAAAPVIASAAMLGGVNGGLSEVARLALPDAQRGATLEAAANLLIPQRRYAEAGALLQAAAASSSDARLRNRANVVSKTKSIDPAALPTTKPAEVVDEVVWYCARNATTRKDDLAPRLSKQLVDAKGKAIERVCSAFVPQGAFTDRDRVSIADALLAMRETKVEGSDALGYRVTVTVQGEVTKLFVVREGKQYQVRAGNTEMSEVGCEALSRAKAGKKAAATQWLDWAKDEFKAGNGDDPLRDAPFFRLWTDKKDDVEASAASLCALGDHADVVAPVLEAALAKASGDRAGILQQALADAYWDDEHATELLAASTKLAVLYPTSKKAWTMRRYALRALGRFTELRDLAADRVAKDANDPEKLDDLATAEELLGHVKAASEVGERLIATGKWGANAYNNQAWRSLYVPAVTDKELGYALQAVTMAPDNWGFLNTLAALDAEAGHVADGVERFRKSFELRGDTEPVDADWFVLGRLAEQLQLPDEARAAYAKIAPAPKRSGAYSVSSLAEKRLRALK